ncbi:TPA: hypothetical protein ACGJP5_004737 [Escherichia coli]
MPFRKGEFGLYDCREQSAAGKLFLAFIAGLVFGVLLTICRFFSGSDRKNGYRECVMQKTTSNFFHYMGIIFSFAFFALWLIMDNNTGHVFWEDALAPLPVCLFIYCMSRFTGWVVNELIRV